MVMDGRKSQTGQTQREKVPLPFFKSPLFVSIDHTHTHTVARDDCFKLQRQTHSLKLKLKLFSQVANCSLILYFKTQNCALLFVFARSFVTLDF